MNIWVNRFEAWQIAQRLPHLLQDIEKEEVDGILQRFHGEDYEPVSLRTMLASLDRYLRDHTKSFSILRDKDFAESRKVLNGKAIELREQGRGKRPKKAHALTEEEEDLLWERKVLGLYSPKSLNLSIYRISQQFKTRGHHEHRQIKLEDLMKQASPSTLNGGYYEDKAGWLAKTHQKTHSTHVPNWRSSLSSGNTGIHDPKTAP